MLDVRVFDALITEFQIELLLKLSTCKTSGHSTPEEAKLSIK